jgi:hypothetical protein
LLFTGVCKICGDRCYITGKIHFSHRFIAITDGSLVQVS